MSDVSSDRPVSIIIPAYNVEKYIKRCLDSVCAQTYGSLQAIVIDDGSKDETLNIAKSYEEDPRIRVIHKENGGVSSARNMAIDLAEGDYIYFLDADDALEPDAIETLVRALESSDADLVSCQYSRWDESGNRLEDYNFTTGEFSFGSDDEKLNFMTQTLMRYLIGFEVWDKLFKTDIIRRGGIQFSEKCRIGEDLGFNLKYLMNCSKLNCIAERPIRYTIRSSSAMGKIDGLPSMLSENVLLAEDIFKYVNDNHREMFIERFPCIFVRILENSYYGHSAAEISDALRSLGDISFIIDRYRDIDTCKEEITRMYTYDVAALKYRYHLYVRALTDGRFIVQRLILSVYDIYRKIRGWEPLKEWKMTY